VHDGPDTGLEPTAGAYGPPRLRPNVSVQKRGTVLSVEDRLAIEALHNEWLNAELRRDTSALLQLCTAAPVWLPPNEAPLCGRAAILNWLAEQPHATVLRIDIDHLAISGLDSFAWKLATFRTTLESPAETAAGVITGAHGWLLQRDDAGAWRIAVVTWTTAAA
jgi:ketosteroid isomerase-like protein